MLYATTPATACWQSNQKIIIIAVVVRVMSIGILLLNKLMPRLDTLFFITFRCKLCKGRGLLHLTFANAA